MSGVDDFLRTLDHPLKPAIQMVRSIILGASPAIAEEIKWNSPSFYLKATGGHFATVNVHSRAKATPCVLVIFHQGAKVKSKSAPAPIIKDPKGILEWLGKERCAARFHDAKEVMARKDALRAIVRQWIKNPER